MAKRSSKSKAKGVTSRANKPDKGQWTFHGSLWGPALAIVVTTFWIYWPALRGDWMGDDPLYVTRNWLLLDPARVWKAWFQPGSFIEYYPIEQTVQWLQWQLWGTETLGYHVTNVALHAINSLLVWHLLNKLGIRLAWLGGLIFAIHPMQVESVAFINELKNTLSLPPFLLALCAWIDFERSRERKFYLAALGWFVAAMLSKITMATFPLLILLYAWYLRGRISWVDLKASAPFFAVSLVFGLVTIWAGQIYAQATHTIPAEIPLGGLFSHIALVGLSAAFYFSRCFLPIHPSFMYPHWLVDPPTPTMFVPWLVFGFAGAFLWVKRGTWGRPALLGCGFFLVFIAPFLGFNKVSYMATVWVMDHFLYLPIIGFIGLTVAAVGAVDDRLQRKLRLVWRGAVGLVLAMVAMESHSYAAMFVNDDTLYAYTIKLNPQAWAARYFLGASLLNKGELSEAREQLEEASALHPGFAGTHANLGILYAQLGKMDDAQKQFDDALRLSPDNAEIFAERGQVYFQAGRVADAIGQLRQSLRLDPKDGPTHMYLGMALFQSGDIPQGLDELDEAARLSPGDVRPYLNRGVALARLGQNSEAATQFELALRIDPENKTARSYLEQLQPESAPTNRH